jgi:Tfp pilus assembly protein PilE
VFCSKCGKEVQDADQHCSACGATLDTSVQVSTLQPKQEDFYRALIGSKNQEYYLRQFEKFDKQGKAGVSWNWPALFFTFYWLLYRKMWGAAVLYFLSPYIIFIPLGIVAAFLGKASAIFIGIAWVIYVIAIIIAPPLYANALYYRQCKKKIAQVASSGHSVERQLGELTGRGGTSKLFLVIFMIAIIALVGILAAIAIPAYHEYTVRAQTAGALELGKRASISVAEYYDKNQQVPPDLGKAGFVQTMPDYVKGISVNTQSGIITVTMSKSPVEDKSLQLLPSLERSGEIKWVCRSKDIPPRYLPMQCKENRP